MKQFLIYIISILLFYGSMYFNQNVDSDSNISKWLGCGKLFVYFCDVWANIEINFDTLFRTIHVFPFT